MSKIVSVSIPEDMFMESQKRHISLSSVLQSALTAEFGKEKNKLESSGQLSCYFCLRKRAGRFLTFSDSRKEVRAFVCSTCIKRKNLELK